MKPQALSLVIAVATLASACTWRMPDGNEISVLHSPNGGPPPVSGGTASSPTGTVGQPPPPPSPPSPPNTVADHRFELKDLGMNPGQVRRGQPVSDFFVEYSSAIPRRARITLFDKNSRIAQSEQVLKSGSHRIALATSSYRFNPAENCFIVQVEMLDNSTRTHREQECAQRLGIADVWTLKFRRTN